MADTLSKQEYERRYAALNAGQRNTVRAHALGVLELLAFDAAKCPPLQEINKAIRRALDAAEAGVQ